MLTKKVASKKSNMEKRITRSGATRAKIKRPVRQNRTMTLKDAHERFGHMNEELTRKSAKHLGIHLGKGTMAPCLACSTAKAKEKKLPR